MPNKTRKFWSPYGVIAKEKGLETSYLSNNFFSDIKSLSSIIL